MRELYIILFAIILFSCGKSPEEEAISAKRLAAHYLSKGECSKALSALNDISTSSDDSVYFSLKASVYECRANYRQLETVLSNLDTLDADTTNLFKTLASFQSAQEVSAPDDDQYVNILKAIEVISNSTSERGSVQRVAKFGTNGGSDLNYQLLLLTTIGLGKYFGAYGNIDSTGSKGAGGGGVVCLAQYNYSNVITSYLDSLANDSCEGATQGVGQTSIAIADPDYIRRLCEGIVLYNNFEDLLLNLRLPTNTSELGNLVDVPTVLNAFKSAAVGFFGLNSDTAALTTYEEIRDVSSCEAIANTSTVNKNYLEAYFSVFLEGNHNS